MRFSHGRIPLGIGGSRFFYSIVLCAGGGEDRRQTVRGKRWWWCLLFPRVEALKYGPGEGLFVCCEVDRKRKSGGRGLFFSNGHRGEKKGP